MPVARAPSRKNVEQTILGTGRPLDFANLVLFEGSSDEECDDDNDDDNGDGDGGDDDDGDEHNEY